MQYHLLKLQRMKNPKCNNLHNQQGGKYCSNQGYQNKQVIHLYGKSLSNKLIK